MSVFEHPSVDGVQAGVEYLYVSGKENVFVEHGLREVE